MPATIKLYGFTGSNSVYTGRLLLEHKGLEYEFVKLPPAVHAPTMLMLGFPTMGVPAIKVGEVRVQGTRWIARALDEMYPDRPLLFPTDPAERRTVEQAERWGEDLQSLALRLMAPAVIKLATGLHRASDEAGREDIELLPARMDKVDAWIADGVLDGAELNAADYQIAVNVSALLLSEDLAPFIEWRPAAALARRVLPDYGGRIGPVVPADWMAELRAAADGSQTGRAVGV